MAQKLWFHGTSLARVEQIKKEGFRAGTYFARHMEDALAYGGEIVFLVRVEFDLPAEEWQACSSNQISASSIASYAWIREVQVMENTPELIGKDN